MMNGDEKHFLETQIAVLRTTVEEWRRSHDLHAKERQTMLCQKLDDFRDKIVKVFTWLENLPCSVTIEKIKNLETNLVNLQTNDIQHLEKEIKGVKDSLDKLHRRLFFTTLGALLSIIVAVIIWIITAKPPILIRP